MRSATQLRKSAMAHIPARGNVLGMTDSQDGRKWLSYLGWVVLCVLVFWKPVFALFHLAEQDETASHIILVPFIAAWLIYTERKQLQVRDSLEFRAALLFAVPALLLTLLVLQCAIVHAQRNAVRFHSRSDPSAGRWVHRHSRQRCGKILLVCFRHSAFRGAPSGKPPE